MKVKKENVFEDRRRARYPKTSGMSKIERKIQYNSILNTET